MIEVKDLITDQNLSAELDEVAKRVGVKNLEEALYFPKYFQIETTRLCNARCPFCAIDQWDKSTPYMSEELFSKIVDEMSRYSDWIEVVSVQRAGEPFMDAKIIDRVRRFKEAGIRRVNMSTNASMLHERKARELLDAGIDEVMLSIDSVDKEPYEMMRKGLNYEKVLANIRTFFRLRDELRPDVIIRVRGVSFHDMDRGDHRAELQRWEDFWGQLRKPQDRIYMKHAHNWGNQKKWDGHTPDYGWVYHPCVLPWSTMHVTAMGKVPLCPQDYDATADIGDINTHTIAEVWRNAKWQEIRRLHSTGNRNEMPLCRGCRLFDKEFYMENWQQKELYEG